MENEISPSSSCAFLSTRLPGGDLVPFMFRRWARLRAQRGWGRCEPLPAHLSDLLYLCPSLPDEGATLAGGDNQPQGDWWLGADGAVGHQRRQILKGERWTKKKKGGGEGLGGRDRLKREKTGSRGGREQTARTKGGLAEGKSPSSSQRFQAAAQEV